MGPVQPRQRDAGPARAHGVHSDAILSCAKATEPIVNQFGGKTRVRGCMPKELCKLIGWGYTKGMVPMSFPSWERALFEGFLTQNGLM